MKNMKRCHQMTHCHSSVPPKSNPDTSWQELPYLREGYDPADIASYMSICAPGKECAQSIRVCLPGELIPAIGCIIYYLAGCTALKGH